MFVDAAFGVSLAKRDDETFYAYMMSFSPMAPFFGVPWRFTEAFQPDPSLSKAAEDAAFTASAVVGKAAEESVKTARRAAEAVTQSSEAATKIIEDAVEVATDVAEKSVEGAEKAAKDLFAAAAPEVEVAEVVETVEEPSADEGMPAGLFAEAPSVVDDLKIIKGVGPKLEAELNGLGIYTFAQIADFSEENLAWLARNLTSVRGRGIRGDLVEQAKELAA